MVSARAKHRTTSRRLDLLQRLRPVLRAPVDAEGMVRSVATLLAVEIGQYCICDLIDAQRTLRRVAIEHADPSRRARLRAICEDATFDPAGRVARLLGNGGNERVPRVTDATRARIVGDVVLLQGERVRSYMAAVVVASGSPAALFTLVTTDRTRRYGAEDLAILEEACDWTGLGVENALRRELQPRTSLLPPANDEAPVSRRATRRRA